MHDRAMFADLIRGIVAIFIVSAVVALGWLNVMDASAASAILGTVMGAVGAQGAAAIGVSRPQQQVERTNTHE